MKTETDKAIEFCEFEIYCFTRNPAYDYESLSKEEKEHIKQLNGVITLLQQGEKYKKMWEELYEVASEFNFFPLMDKLKQKYFPKEAK